jgi:hypothetical protein
MFTAKDAMYQSMAYTDKKTSDIPKTSTLEDLTDVNITSPSDGEVLKYDAESEKWVNGEGGGSSQEDYEINIYTPDPGVYSIYDEITFSDIVSAYASGKRLVAFMHGEAGIGPYWYDDVKMFLTSVESYLDSDYVFNFCMTAVDRYHEGKPYVASIISIKEGDDDTPVVIGGPEETEPEEKGPFIITSDVLWADIVNAFNSGRPIFAWSEDRKTSLWGELVPLNQVSYDFDGDKQTITSFSFLQQFIEIDAGEDLVAIEWTILENKSPYAGGAWQYGPNGFFEVRISTHHS